MSQLSQLTSFPERVVFWLFDVSDYVSCLLVSVSQDMVAFHLIKLNTFGAKFAFLSKTSQIIFDLHPGFSHMEDEKGNKLHLFKKYFKMMFFLLYKPSLVLIVIHFNRFVCHESFCKEKLKSKICGF